MATPKLTPLQELEQTLAASSPPTAPGQPAEVTDTEPVAPIAGSDEACDAALLHHLAVRSTVSETYFFRHPEHFEALAEFVVPPLLQSGRTALRAWSAGCATGEEAYSLAALLLATANSIDWPRALIRGRYCAAVASTRSTLA